MGNFFFVPRLWQDEKHLSLFLWSLCGSVVKLRSAEFEGLRFDSSWRFFSMSKDEKHLSLKRELVFLAEFWTFFTLVISIIDNNYCGKCEKNQSWERGKFLRSATRYSIAFSILSTKFVVGDSDWCFAEKFDSSGNDSQGQTKSCLS